MRSVRRAAAAVAKSVAVLGLGLAIPACGASAGAELTYKPPFVPVEFSLDTNGVFRAATKGVDITTFVGTFSLKPDISVPLADGSMRLSIQHVVDGHPQFDVSDIAESGPTVICLDGSFQQTISQDEIDLTVRDDTSTVRLGDPAAADPCRSDGARPDAGATPRAAGVVAPAPAPAPSYGGGAVAAAPAAASVRGTWEGTYTCAQGETGLRLTIGGSSDGALDATFAFYPVASNPTVPPGSFAMTGDYSAGQLQLHADHWIDQPNGYTMVDLSGRVVSADAIDGSVLAQVGQCDTFSVRRTDEAAAASATSPVGTWVGTYSCAQGETGLRLSITAGSSSGLDATFAFYPLPDNPGAASGRFTMHGRSTSEGLLLVHDQWVEQPDGYTMVDLVSDPGSSSATVLRGRVRGSGCDTFRLRRSA